MDAGEALEARYDTGALGRLPEKVKGQHRWMAAAAYTLSDEEVRRCEGGEPVQLDHENRTSFSVGCWDCEQPYGLVKDQPCPGEGRDLYGNRITDPAESESDLPPAGTAEMVVSTEDLDKVMLGYGFGVQPVLTASGDDEPTEHQVQCLVSLVGRRNHTDEEFHHLYMLTPGSLGLFMAQLMHGIVTLGAAGQEAVEAFEVRMAELTQNPDTNG